MTTTSAVATLPATIAAQVVAQARAESPSESCGLIIGTAPPAEDGVALRYLACRNELASPVRYAIDADELLRHTRETDDADEAFWAIVHSHPSTAATPSAMDLERATHPDALYLIVSLARPEPVMRAWRIVDGRASEVRLVVGR